MCWHIFSSSQLLVPAAGRAVWGLTLLLAPVELGMEEQVGDSGQGSPQPVFASPPASISSALPGSWHTLCSQLCTAKAVGTPALRDEHPPLKTGLDQVIRARAVPTAGLFHKARGPGCSSQAALVVCYDLLFKAGQVPGEDQASASSSLAGFRFGFTAC